MTHLQMLALVRDMLSFNHLPVDTEQNLQNQIQRMLVESEIPFIREKALNSRDRIDFLIGDIGIEAKLKGSYTQVASQLLRYSESNLVNHILLVTNKAAHRQLQHLPTERKIPIDVIFIGYNAI